MVATNNGSIYLYCDNTDLRQILFELVLVSPGLISKKHWPRAMLTRLHDRCRHCFSIRAGAVRQFAQPSRFDWFAAIHLASGYFTLSG